MKLFNRPDGRSENWYVRIIIPTPLQKVCDADRFIASTKSSDKTLARARAAEIVAVWERKLYHQALTALACPPCTRRTASSLSSSVYAALLPFSVVISHLLDRQLYTRLRSTFFRGNLSSIWVRPL